MTDHDVMAKQPKESAPLALVLSSKPVPLKFSSEGCAYVGGTRVTLESVVFHFNRGATPEEILQSFPSLRLADIYAVLSYYLHEQETVDSYLSDFRSRYEDLREQAREKTDAACIRERLLARKKNSACGASRKVG